jgi:tripartite ATP-independent transporter DctP family solute receptor
MKFWPVLLSLTIGISSTALAADYKPEFKMSIVGPNEENPWGRAATRFADVVKYRTQGRIQIKNYFSGRLFAGKQTTEFAHLQQGLADFSIGSTINWSPQVIQLNVFALPFMFPGYSAVDAVESGEPGERLFKVIERNGAIPIAWGENGFRELTNSKRPIHRPEDLDGLKIRVVGVPLFVEIFQALGANPVPMNFDEALEAFRRGTVDGQENPAELIISHKLWAVHKYVTLWRYTIDPLILAVSARTWEGLSREDQGILRKAGEEVMGQQKTEAREGLKESNVIIEKLRDLYLMEVFNPSPADMKLFRNKTHSVYNKWSDEIGIELVRSVEGLVANAK